MTAGIFRSTCCRIFTPGWSKPACFSRTGISWISDAALGNCHCRLVARGYQVTGVDFAEAMLERYRSKGSAKDRIKLLQADVRRLPIASHSADAAVSSKLLMHVPRWQLAVAEIVRVVKPKGYFFHIYERGAFVNQVRSRFAGICDALGYKNRHPGLQREEHLANYLTSLGARPLAIAGSVLRWSKRVSYREALGGFEDRLFGEFWELKDSVYGSHPGTSEGMGGNPARWLGYYRADDALVRDGCLRAAVIADSTEVFLSI